ncbi:hypothetical protein PR048_015093 [Dryococelus australis]|uniref:Uncharacterized protein n=1 Tax=Dryococelus australis TaxID=614101 RepID=A0ABQ9HGH9_9NEOP|nr:hypothetical protein PR048_015093 [Dryococelus australis]
MLAYTRQKAKSKCGNSIRLKRASQKQSSDTHNTPYDRMKRCRERKINIKASEHVNIDVFTQNKRPSRARARSAVPCLNAAKSRSRRDLCDLGRYSSVVRTVPVQQPQHRNCKKRATHPFQE